MTTTINYDDDDNGNDDDNSDGWDDEKDDNDDDDVGDGHNDDNDDDKDNDDKMMTATATVLLTIMLVILLWLYRIHWFHICMYFWFDSSCSPRELTCCTPLFFPQQQYWFPIHCTASPSNLKHPWSKMNGKVIWVALIFDILATCLTHSHAHLSWFYRLSIMI